MKHLCTIVIMLCCFSTISCSFTPRATQDYKAYRSTQKVHTLSEEEGNLKYIDKGKGEAIVLLHGVPSSGWLYRKMVDGLVAEGYRVIVPDMLGYGSSSHPRGYDIYKPEEQAKRLVSLMDSLGIQKWNHVFHDVGGMWTWELMRHHEHRVNRLVMLNSVNLKEGFLPPIQMKPGKLAKIAMWGYRNKVTNKVVINRLFKETLQQPKTMSKSDTAGYKTPLLEGKTDALYYFFTQTCSSLPDYSDVIKKVNVKTTVIWGRHDEMLQWKPQATKLQQMLSISDENVHLIDARHFIQEEKPNEVNQLIVNFLKK